MSDSNMSVDNATPTKEKEVVAPVGDTVTVATDMNSVASTIDSTPPMKSENNNETTTPVSAHKFQGITSPSVPFCRVFLMDNGKKMKFQNLTEAQLCQDDNMETIQDSIDFESESECKECMKRPNDHSPNSGSNNSDTLTLEEKQALSRINSRRRQNAPTKHIALRCRTTAFSRAVAVFMEPLDHEGKKLWHWKPRDIAPTIKSFIQEGLVVINRDATRMFIERMDSAEKRDPEKTENDAKKSRGCTDQILWSHLELPLKPGETWTREAEKKWILDTLTGVGNEVKRLLSSALFIASHKDTVGSHSTKLADLIFEPASGKGPDFKTFINQSTVTVAPFHVCTEASETENILRCVMPCVCMGQTNVVEIKRASQDKRRDLINGLVMKSHSFFHSHMPQFTVKNEVKFIKRALNMCDGELQKHKSGPKMESDSENGKDDESSGAHAPNFNPGSK